VSEKGLEDTQADLQATRKMIGLQCKGVDMS